MTDPRSAPLRRLAILALLGAALSRPAPAQEITVDSASPSEAPQGVVGLEVTIAGSGFGKGAQVAFLVTGTTDPGGITVAAAKVRGSQKIIATIDVSASATVGDFDIEVQVNGRRGKGTRAFAVKLGGGNDGVTLGNFRVVIDWDGAKTEHDFYDATVDCTNGQLCDISSFDTFTFRIPESYWSAWSLSDAQECFGASLGYGMAAEVTATQIKVRDHHGSPDHWSANVDFLASFIGTTAIGIHHADFQGDCAGPCIDLPPAEGVTNAYDMGYLTRTSRGTRTKKLKGDACTCAWEECTFLPNEVTVTVTGLP